MAEARPKVFEYAIAIDASGEATIPGGAALRPPADWSADHLLLAALLRCSIDSLAYHARRVGSATAASGSATGTVTKRETDGRYAFVEIGCSIEAVLDPPVSDSADLIARAERDCFIGASLTVKPRYEWRVG